MNVLVIKYKDPPSCCNCEYATKYIPSYSYPWNDPYCSKGHGKCEINKLCDDYKSIYEVCGNCEHIQKNYNKFICKVHDVEIEYNKKTCEEFQKME